MSRSFDHRDVSPDTGDFSNVELDILSEDMSVRDLAFALQHLNFHGPLARVRIDRGVAKYLVSLLPRSARAG